MASGYNKVYVDAKEWNFTSLPSESRTLISYNILQPPLTY